MATDATPEAGPQLHFDCSCEDCGTHGVRWGVGLWELWQALQRSGENPGGHPMTVCFIASGFCPWCGDALHADGTRTPDGAAMAALREHTLRLACQMVPPCHGFAECPTRASMDPFECRHCDRVPVWEADGPDGSQMCGEAADPAEAIMAAVAQHPLPASKTKEVSPDE